LYLQFEQKGISELGKTRQNNKEEFMFLLELVKNENPPFLTGINNNVPEHSCAHRCC
jgi:hypothetical protein